MAPCRRLAIFTSGLFVSTPRWLQCGVRGGGPILAAAKQPAAFECTERQEAEDLASIAAKEYRYHQAMVRLGVCALKASEEGSIALDKSRHRGHKRSSGSATRKNSAELRQKIQEQAEEGKRWLEEAAALGNPEAKNNLGTLWAAGHPRLGLAPDLARAQALFLEAASGGCADAMFNLGNLLDRTGFLPESPASGGSSSSSSSGERKSNKNVEKAETSTEGIGDTSGAGSEGTFNDDEASAEAARAAAAEAAAAHWFAQAAALNHVEAHHALALMEVSGRGVPQDLPSAARRLRKVLLLAQPPPPLSASASPSASASASSSGKNHRRRNRRGNEEEIDRREKEEADDDDSGEMIEEEEVTKSAIETSKTNSFLNAQYLLGILALKGELNNIEDGFSLLDGIVPGQTSSSSSSSTVSGEASAVNLVAAGVRLIRAAAQSGHLQARNQLETLLESVDATQRHQILSGM